MAYGLGGYEAPAGGLLRGIQTGVGIFREAEADRRAQEELDLRKQQTQQTMAIQSRQQQRLEDEESRRVTKDTGDTLTKNLATAKDELAGLMQQYGGDAKAIPGDQRAAAVSRVLEANNLYNAHVRKQSAPLIKQFNDHVQQVSADLASGRVQPQDVDPDVFYKAVVGAAHRPVQDLVASEGKPALVQQAHDNIVQGLDSGNMHQLYEGLDQFFAPELSKIKGKSTPMGVATGARFLRLDPAPGTNDRVMPTLLVTTDLHPEGYAAPISEFRSSDAKNDPNIQTFRIDDVMERIGKTVLLSQYLSSPEGQKKLQQASPKALEDVDKFLAALPHSTKEFKTQVVDLGNKKTAVTTGPGGRVVSKEDIGEVGLNPNIERRAAATEAAAETRAEASKSNAATRAGATVQAAGLRATGRGGKAAGKPMTKAEADLKIKSEAAGYGLRLNGKEWQQQDPKTKRWVPASPESEQKVGEITARVSKEMERSRTGQKGGGDLRAQAESAIAAGKDPDAVAARYKELTGEDY